jgi:23S rRNA (adenine2503-C2)-methyltransferase
MFPAGDDRRIETALIPDRERRTICLSTQAGCRRACRFCFTAKSGFAGNLEAWAIINQYASCPQREQIDNIVFMGMGEPFDNCDEVFKALEIFTADYGYALSPSRITVSTVGVIAGIERYLRECRSHLAISLNSPFPEERLQLMPAEQGDPIKDVLRILRREDWSGQRRLTFEYIMFRGVNDAPRHSRELARLLKGLECRVNLIAFNEGEGIDFQASERAVIEDFQDDLRRRGIRTTIRKSKGEDIAAACGQLVLSRGG